jgi:hypothetical protein
MQAGCGEEVPVFRFHVDGGALTQLADEVGRWCCEHVEIVVGDGVVVAVWPSEFDGFQAVISVEIGSDERA